MTRIPRRQPVPPFVELSGRLYVVTNWDEETEDAKGTLLLRPASRAEARLHRSLVGDAACEAFSRIKTARRRQP